MSARRRAGIASLCALLFAPLAFSQPAAPQVTYRSDTKQVLLDWNYVPRANYYELWFKPNAGAAAVKFGDRPSWNPHWVHNISAHLHHWSEARWEIKACNPSGCTGSGLIDIGSTIVDTVGYFKPPHPQTEQYFGRAVAISEDGQTTAAFATGRAFVYHRVDGVWGLEAELAPSVPWEGGNDPNVSVALSRDGNALLFVLPGEQWGATPDDVEERGAAYYYRRSGTTWALEHRFAMPNVLRLGQFAAMSEAGDVVALFYMLDDFPNPAEHVQISRRTASGWTVEKTLPSLARPALCNFDGALSGDGKVFVRRCYSPNLTTAPPHLEVFAAPSWSLRDSFAVDAPAGFSHGTGGVRPLAIDYTGDVIATAEWTTPPTSRANYRAENWKREVRVFRRDGGAYQLAATLHPSPFQPTSYEKRSMFGEKLAISRGAEYIAVLDQHDAIEGHVEPPPTSAGANIPPRGAVYLFERRGTGYGLRRHIGVTMQTADDRQLFNVLGGLAFGNAGRSLVIGHPGDRSNGQGVSGGRNDTSLVNAGAFWLY